MSDLRITDAEFIKAMEDAVREKGADYVYPDPDFEEDGTSKIDDYHNTDTGNCVYSTPSGVPACIIGVAMDKAGLRVPRYDSSDGAYSVLERFVSTAIRQAANEAQAEQDRGMTWGHALEKFKRVYGELA